MALELSIVSNSVVSGSATMKYWQRPKRGSTSASKLGPVAEIAIFIAYLCSLLLFSFKVAHSRLYPLELAFYCFRLVSQDAEFLFPGHLRRKWRVSSSG
jgi:hypothetical protein